VKSLLTILFSLALVWAQSAPAVCAQAAPAAAGRSACACCNCGDASCCMNRTAPSPQPTPAAPAPSSSQHVQLLLLAPATVAFVLPRTASAQLAHPLSSLSRAAAPPLYQQNCSFLL